MSASPDGLIDPEAFPVASVEIDARAVEDAAAEMASLGSRVGVNAADVLQAWRGLRAGYLAPEQDRVHTLVQPAVAVAGEVDTRLTRGSRALERFAEELRSLRPRLADVEQRARLFRDETLRAQANPVAVAGDHATDWWTDPAAVRANEDLLHEHAMLMRQLTHASEECEDALRGLCGAREGSDRSSTLAAHATATPSMPARRGHARVLPRVILHEENPIHAELDLLGLLPIVGEPADAINAVIYAWEQDWVNAWISMAGVAPVVGSAGTLARVAARTGVMASGARTPRLTQAALEHIVERHWHTSGSKPGAGRFADGLSVNTLSHMIAAALEHGVVRSNTRNRPGAIYEIDLVRVIGVSGAGEPTSRLRVILNGAGEIRTAFPF